MHTPILVLCDAASTGRLFPELIPMGDHLDALSTWMVSSLQLKANGVVALALLVVPLLIALTQYNDFYGDTVGYGLSIFLQAWFLRSQSSALAPEPLSVGDFATGACLFYGARLAIYMYIRERVTNFRPHNPQEALPRLCRIPESMALALFYACLISPVLFLLQRPPETLCAIRVGGLGTALAWMGVLLEAQADAQKFSVKVGRRKSQQHKATPVTITTFHGPTNGVFRWCRHPNYAGELMFWFGLWLAAVPSFSSSLPATLCTMTGQIGVIYVVLRVALRNVESNQTRNYGGQISYEQWKEQVPSTILPFVPMAKYFCELFGFLND